MLGKEIMEVISAIVGPPSVIMGRAFVGLGTYGLGPYGPLGPYGAGPLDCPSEMVSAKHHGASNGMNVYRAFINYYSYAFIIYGIHCLISWISTPALRQALRIGRNSNADHDSPTPTPHENPWKLQCGSTFCKAESTGDIQNSIGKKRNGDRQASLSLKSLH